MRFVVRRKVDWPFVLQFFADVVRDPEFLRHPFLHGTVVRDESTWPDFEICKEDAVEEFKKWFLVETDGIDIVHSYSCVLQRVVDSVFWE